MIEIEGGGWGVNKTQGAVDASVVNEGGEEVSKEDNKGKHK